MKRIWTYWEGHQPQIVKTCLASWSTFAPDWEITVIDKDTVFQYDIDTPSTFEQLGPTARSDVIRLSLLSKYGGLWMDASVLLLHDLDWVLERCDGGNPFFGFTLHDQYIENWFLYAPTANHTMSKWLRTFNDILELWPVCSSHPAYELPCTPLGNHDDYFMCYQAFCHLKRTDAQFAADVDDIPNVSPSFYTPFIPLHYHDRLVKFTKVHRTLYPYVRFPLCYVYILVLLAIIMMSVVIFAF